MVFWIFDDGGELVDMTYADIKDERNVRILRKDRIFRSAIVNAACRFHLSQAVNKRVSLPLKGIWFRALCRRRLSGEDGKCYVFTPSWYIPELFDWLRKNDPGCRLVLYFKDTVASKLRAVPAMNIDDIKKHFDLVLTYSPLDAEKYGFVFSPVRYSRTEINPSVQYPHCDVLFIGAAKDRLARLVRIYRKLTDAGLSCYFYITGVPRNQRQYGEEIVYADKAMPATEMLGREIAADCLVEVLQQGTTGRTLRMMDAVMYNKKLITNCPEILQSKYYNRDYVFYYEDPEQIDPAFVRKDAGAVDYRYDGDFSPWRLLRLLEDRLGNDGREGPGGTLR